MAFAGFLCLLLLQIPVSSGYNQTATQRQLQGLSGARCGRTGQVCADDEACVGYYHSWGCVGGCAQNVARQQPQGDWDGCSTCGDRAEYLMNWNNPGGGLS